eukprot:5319644-Prymnesium_polylepis.2
MDERSKRWNMTKLPLLSGAVQTRLVFIPKPGCPNPGWYSCPVVSCINCFICRTRCGACRTRLCELSRSLTSRLLLSASSRHPWICS